MQGLISPLNLGATSTDRYPEDAEHAFQTLKLPGMESPRRKSLRYLAAAVQNGSLSRRCRAADHEVFIPHRYLQVS